MENGKQGAFAMLDSNGSFTQYGLTKREYFAVHIATGLSVRAIAGRHNGINEMEVEIPLYSVRLADAILKALDNGTEKNI